VQCKHARLQGGCVLFNSRSTDHGGGQGDYLGLADLFGVYLPVPRSVYLVPVRSVPRNTVYLRLEPTLNNQRRGVRMAADYLIDRWTSDNLTKVLAKEAEQSGAPQTAAA
jgi:hypothetical protein